MDWNDRATGWVEFETMLEAAHAPVLHGLVARAGMTPGARILDIGGGSGSTALAVAQIVGPKGAILSMDIAAPMVARAVARTADLPNVDVVVGDAEFDPLPEVGFDIMISLFGTMFFDNPVAAFQNIARGVVPGGRFHFATWASPQNNPWFGLAGRRAVERLGPMPPPVPHASGPFGFADAERTLALIADAALVRGTVETVDLDLRPMGSPADVSELLLRVGSAASVVDALAGTPVDVAEIHKTLSADIQELIVDGAVRFPAQIHFYSAQKPG
jgi:SAM-dependent methyltransferase